MASVQQNRFTTNDIWTPDFPAANRTDFRTLAYEGDLGGGTLRLYTLIGDVDVPVPDSKLSAATLDSQGEVVKSFPFRSAGQIKVELSGATAPDVIVVVL